MNRLFHAMLAAPTPAIPVRGHRPEVVFRGRTPHDTKRAMLRYWSQNESRLGMELEEFQRCCSWTDDESVVFQTRV